MVANFHFALGSYFSLEFFIDGAGLPVMGGLLALTIGGSAPAVECEALTVRALKPAPAYDAGRTG